jgi:hypothetical protein
LGNRAFPFALFDNRGHLLSKRKRMPVRDNLFHVLGLDAEESSPLEREPADEWADLPVQG